MEPNATDSALLDPPGTTDPAPSTDRAETTADSLVDDELLVEEISIDGMCGVY